MSEHHAVARVFAESAMALARKTDTIPDWLATLTRLGAVVCPPDIDPSSGPRSITVQQIRDCLDGAGQPLSEEQRKFVDFLADNGRLDVLPETAELFAELCVMPARTASAAPEPGPAVPDSEKGGVRPENRGDMSRLQQPCDTGSQEEQGAPSKPEEQVTASGSKESSFSTFELLDLDGVPVVVPEFVDVRAGIETMPRLQSRICGIWGTQELDVFLNDLVMDSRDGARNGFPVEVAAEILFLTELNRWVRAINLAKVSGMKFDAAFKVVDEGDETRNRRDVWDNPNSSLGTAFREVQAGSRASRDESAGHGNPLLSLFKFLMSLVLNKWVVGVIAITLTARLIWGG